AGLHAPVAPGGDGPSGELRDDGGGPDPGPVPQALEPPRRPGLTGEGCEGVEGRQAGDGEGQAAQEGGRDTGGEGREGAAEAGHDHADPGQDATDEAVLVGESATMAPWH